MTERDPDRPGFRAYLRDSFSYAISILGWFFGRIDLALIYISSVIVKWFCGWSGRSNFWLAKVLLGMGVGVYGGQALWDLLVTDSVVNKTLLVLFVPPILLAGRLAYRELDQFDKTPPSEVILTGQWTLLLKRNRLFWCCLGLFLAVPPSPRPMWLFVGFAGYVAEHINRGGKSVFQRAKEWLQEKAQVLVPSPVPA